MDAEKWLEIKEVFNQAIELSSTERESFLNERLKNEPEIRLEVEKLLAADEDAATSFDKISFFPKNDIAVPAKIGNYEILKKIGEGGMGVVYLAERHDLKQKVALKMIVRGADSDVIFKRFRREQEILAALEHPNIARLIDVGVTTDGTPFLAMEYVEGEDLTEFSRRRQLSLNEKLNLYRKVCEAVSYAHSRLIVHRDLKPSNIIVNENGEPKLLDFGISKLISETETDVDKGTVTSLGMLTPNYASPEQFRGETVSTSTDIYSLGVILYELLTDSMPYQVNDKRIDQIARAVIETNPPKPSEVVFNQQLSNSNLQFADHAPTGKNKSQTSENQTKTNSKSRTQNLKLLRGDLDNILLKALRKEPARRYSSVEQFAEDLRRHQAGLPVTARPDTFAYRAEKFISRNRISVVSAAFVFLALIGGVAGISWQYLRAERERQLAEQRFVQVRELANKVVFKYHDGIANLPGSTEIRQMLVNDATTYLDNLAQDAGNDAELKRELANAYVKLGDVQGKTYYSNLGDTRGAIENYGKAIKILENLAFATDHHDKEKAVDDLILAYQTLGMMQARTFAFPEAVAMQQTALALVEEKAARHPDNTDVQYLIVRAKGRFGDALRDNGNFNEAIEIYRQTLVFDEELFERAPKNENVEVAVAVLNDRIGRNLALRAIELKKIGVAPEFYEKLFVDAEIHLDKMRSGFEKLTVANPTKKKYQRDLSTAFGNLGMIYRETGRLNESREILENDLRRRETVAVKDLADRESQADLSEGIWNLAQTKFAQKEFPAAFADFTRAIEIYNKLIAADSANIEFRSLRFEVENYFADALLQKGEIEKALQKYETAFERLKKDAPDNLYFKFAEGITNEKIGDFYAAQEKTNPVSVVRSNDAYRKTLQLWEPEQIRRGFLGRTPERLEFLQRKVSATEQILARVNN